MVSGPFKIGTSQVGSTNDLVGGGSVGGVSNFKNISGVISSVGILTYGINVITGSALLFLDGLGLTDQGRTFSADRDLRHVQNELANGSLRRYLKDSRKKFSVEWKMLPSLAASTWDQMQGRNYLVSKAHLGTQMVLLVRYPTGGDESYNVFIESYQEKLIRRREIDGDFFWDVSLEMVEI